MNNTKSSKDSNNYTCLASESNDKLQLINSKIYSNKYKKHIKNNQIKKQSTKQHLSRENSVINCSN